MSETPTLFADGVLEATVRHGTVRLRLAVQDAEGKPAPTGLLVIPLAQMPAVIGAMSRLMREVETKAREGRAAAPPQEAPAEMPATFRFQG